MVNLGVDDPGLARRPRITLLDKRGRRRIENLRQIAAALAAEFPLVQIVVQDGRAMERMSIRQQVRSKPVSHPFPFRVDTHISCQKAQYGW